MTLSRRTAWGAAWLVLARLITRAVDFVALLILARFLTPADFGLVAIAMTSVFIVEAIFELPLEQAMVRLPELKRGHFDTAFTLSILRGVGLMILLALLSLPFAHFYADARLIPLICVLSVAPAARGALSPRLASYVQQLDYRRDFAVQLSGKIAALLVASALAISTGSYWAIAAGSITTPLTMIAVSYVLAPYRPRFSLSEKAVFIPFLGWTTSAQLVMAFNWQCDRLILGRFTSHGALGAFSLASDLSAMPDQILVKSLLRPLVSAFSLVRHDLPRLREAYAKATFTILVVGLPVMLTLSLLADPIVRVALGGRWLVAIPTLQWLALSFIPPMFVAPLTSLAVALDSVHIFLRQSMIELCVKVPLVAAGVILFGVPGVIAARLLSAVTVALVWMLFTRSLVGIPLLRQIFAPWRVLASGAILTIAILALRPALNSLVGLELGFALAAVAAAAFGLYVATLFLLWHSSGRPSGLEETVHRVLMAAWQRPSA